MRIRLVFGVCLALLSSCAPAADAPAATDGARAARVIATPATRPTDTVTATGTSTPAASEIEPGTVRPLPAHRTSGGMSLEQALATRRSIREFRPDALSDADVGQLLWAAQGITDAAGHRTAPSAGALYPLELYVATEDGVFAYLPAVHGLAALSTEDRRLDLGFAALGQEAVGAAPLVIVITGVVERTAARYGERAERYVTLEAGHAAQNVLLEATALGLGAVPVGSFDDATIARVLGLPADRRPFYLIPVGRPR